MLGKYLLGATVGKTDRNKVPFGIGSQRGCVVLFPFIIHLFPAIGYVASLRGRLKTPVETKVLLVWWNYHHHGCRRLVIGSRIYRTSRLTSAVTFRHISWMLMALKIVVAMCLNILATADTLHSFIIEPLPGSTAVALLRFSPHDPSVPLNVWLAPYWCPISCAIVHIKAFIIVPSPVTPRAF